jgi:hypothetical protein
MLKETGQSSVSSNTSLTAPTQNLLQDESISGGIIRFVSFLSCLAVIFYCFEVRWFSFHPILMTFAFTYMISEGILTAREMKNRPMERKQLVQSHLLLQFGTLLCGGFGFLVILSNKIYYNKMHFQSWHSILGLFTIVGICIEVLIGLYMQYRWLRNVLSPLLRTTQPNSVLPTTLPTATTPVLNMDLQSMTVPITTAGTTTNGATLPVAKKKGSKTSTMIAYIHRLLGLAVFFAGLVTISTGFRSDFFTERVHFVIQIVLTSFMVILGLCIIIVMRRRDNTSISSVPTTKPILPTAPKLGRNNLLSSLGGTTDMLSFLPMTVTVPPTKDINTTKDK